MANPNYPNYPPGGGYPSQPYPGQGGPGMTQAAAPAQPPPQQQLPAPPPRGPKEPSALGPPSGPAKMLYIGLVLILFSFSIKQFFVDLTLKSSSGLFEVERLRAEQEVATNEIDAELDEIDAQIDELQADSPKPPDAKSADSMRDSDSYSDKMKKFEEKMEKLTKERSNKDKDLEDKRKEIKKKYRPLMREAARSADSSRASGLGKIQLTLLFKLLMDLLKIAGALITVLSGLNIAANPDQSSHMKIFASVMAGVALLAVIAGGLSTLFS
ncbi:MAG: hypothetical protein U0414_28710 [Polyangiaceae bacterium]